MALPHLPVSTRFDPRTGEAVPVAPGLARVTAPNRGPLTFTGTNSFIIGDESVAVLDPGPDDDAHLAALVAAIGGREVEAILMTHTHKDHSALAPRLAAETGAPLWFGGPHRLSRPLREGEDNPFGTSADWTLAPDRVLLDGERLAFGGRGLSVVALPGHCANHLGFLLEDGGEVLVGDHVMGWSSTVVASPDGSLADYLASLDRLIGLGERRYLPAHGGAVEAGPSYAEALKAYRLARNRQVLAALEGGPRTLEELVGRLYPEVPEVVREAARRTLVAHLDHLAADGLLALETGPGMLSARLL